MLRHFSVLLLFSALVWAQNPVPGCANRQGSPSLAQSTENKDKVGLKQRLKDQFGSGWCGSVMVAGGCQHEKTPDEQPTPSSMPSPTPTAAQNESTSSTASTTS